MLEVESSISFNTGVQVSEENNVGDMLHVIAELFRISVGLDLEDGLTLLDSLQLIPEHNRLVSFLVPFDLAIELMLTCKVQRVGARDFFFRNLSTIVVVISEATD